MTNFKTIGAALMIEDIAVHLDWLNNESRDLEVQDFFQHELLDGDWQSKAKEANELLAGYQGRIGIHGPFWGLHLANPDSVLRNAVKKRLMQGLAAAETIKASHMVIHSPIDPWLHRHMLNNKEQTARVIDLMKDTLFEPLLKAEAIGCTLVMEDIMDLDPRMQLDLIKAMDSDAIKMSIDVGHAYCMHKQHGAPPPDQFIAEAGASLEHVHLQDTDGYLDRHWLPGEGSINFKAIFEELAKLKQSPRMIIEVKEKTRVQQAENFLGQFLSIP